MDMSKDNFIKLTTEGYPLELSHSKESFYKIFTEFVNETKENNFYAELSEDGVFMHAGMRTEASETCEFSKDEILQVLGMACLGVLYFCDLYAGNTGQSVLSTKTDPIDHNKFISKNNKYNAWPV